MQHCFLCRHVAVQVRERVTNVSSHLPPPASGITAAFLPEFQRLQIFQRLNSIACRIPAGECPDIECTRKAGRCCGKVRARQGVRREAASRVPGCAAASTSSTASSSSRERTDRPRAPPQLAPPRAVACCVLRPVAVAVAAACSAVCLHVPVNHVACPPEREPPCLCTCLCTLWN